MRKKKYAHLGELGSYIVTMHIQDRGGGAFHFVCTFLLLFPNSFYGILMKIMRYCTSKFHYMENEKSDEKKGKWKKNRATF